MTGREITAATMNTTCSIFGILLLELVYNRLSDLF